MEKLKMANCFIIAICLTFSAITFAQKSKDNLVKTTPCDLIRKENSPLSGKLCDFYSNDKVIITTCTNTKCTKRNDQIAKELTSSNCENSSPTTPEFKSLEQARLELINNLKSKIDYRSVKLLASVSDIENETFSPTKINFYSFNRKKPLTTKKDLTKISEVLKLKAVVQNSKEIKLAFIDSNKNSELFYSYIFNKISGFKEAKIEELVEDCPP